MWVPANETKKIPLQSSEIVYFLSHKMSNLGAPLKVRATPQCSRTQMNVEMRFPWKASTTRTAQVQSLVRVCSRVYAQIARSEKCPWTIFTFVRPILGMSFHMLLQYVRRCEASITFRALESFQSGVNGRVTCQRDFSIKCPIACIAFEWFHALNGMRRKPKLKAYSKVNEY